MHETEFAQCPCCKKFVDETTTGSCLGSDYWSITDVPFTQCEGQFFCKECLDEQCFCPDCRETLSIDVKNEIIKRAGN